MAGQPKVLPFQLQFPGLRFSSGMQEVYTRAVLLSICENGGTS